MYRYKSLAENPTRYKSLAETWTEIQISIKELQNEIKDLSQLMIEILKKSTFILVKGMSLSSIKVLAGCGRTVSTLVRIPTQIKSKNWPTKSRLFSQLWNSG